MNIKGALSSLFGQINGGLSPTPPNPAQIELPYAAYGYLPGVAQAAQAGVYPNPHLNPQPQWTQDQIATANWFTTRVHLAPIGKAQ